MKEIRILIQVITFLGLLISAIYWSYTSLIFLVPNTAISHLVILFQLLFIFFIIILRTKLHMRFSYSKPQYFLFYEIAYTAIYASAIYYFLYSLLYPQWQQQWQQLLYQFPEITRIVFMYILIFYSFITVYYLIPLLSRIVFRGSNKNKFVSHTNDKFMILRILVYVGIGFCIPTLIVYLLRFKPWDMYPQEVALVGSYIIGPLSLGWLRELFSRNTRKSPKQ